MLISLDSTTKANTYAVMVARDRCTPLPKIIPFDIATVLRASCLICQERISRSLPLPPKGARQELIEGQIRHRASRRPALSLDKWHRTQAHRHKACVKNKMSPGDLYQRPFPGHQYALYLFIARCRQAVEQLTLTGGAKAPLHLLDLLKGRSQIPKTLLQLLK